MSQTSSFMDSNAVTSSSDNGGHTLSKGTSPETYAGTYIAREDTQIPQVSYQSPGTGDIKANASKASIAADQPNGAPFFGLKTNASQLLRSVLLNNSPASRHPPLDSPSIFDDLTMPSPSFSSSSSLSNSPLSTPAQMGQNMLALHADGAPIQSSPMAPLDDFDNLPTLSRSNLLGLDGMDFPHPKEQAILTQYDSDAISDGVNEIHDADIHSIQCTLSQEHITSLLQCLHGSSASIRRDGESHSLTVRLGPIALNIKQGPY
jgi:hypothetical protein